uniref:Uncharacterized protein n=1 Tax=Siphoviridae sp. ctnpt50 TaxID=2827941 RepID=A0A8S5SDN0_9CAUD|nr:MAG TPA: hypothetical protein [Siphoviridae sp. ctnpt50]
MNKEFVVKLIEKLGNLVVKDDIDNKRGHLNINLSFMEIGTIIGALQALIDDCEK